MKVKLLKAVQGIGRAGDIVNVSDPQARNFLIPKKLAVLATGAVIKAQEQTVAHQHQRQTEQQAAIASLIQRLEGQSLQMVAKANEQGTLFAALKTSDIQTALEKQFGLQLTNMTSEPDHLKTIGTHQVRIVIDHDHQASLTIIIQHGS